MYSTTSTLRSGDDAVFAVAYGIPGTTNTVGALGVQYSLGLGASEVLARCTVRA